MPEAFDAVEVIKAKRDGGELTPELGEVSYPELGGRSELAR